MRHRTGTIIAGALLAGTAAACGNSYPTNFIDSSDKQLVEDTVHATGAFWAQHGIALGNTLKSTVVVGDEAFKCGGSTITSESGEMLYCSGDNTMAFSVGGLNELRVEFKANAQATIRTWVREAVGGLVQQTDPSLTQNAPTDDRHDFYLREQRACLGGIATYNLQPSDTTASFQVYLHTGDSHAEGHWLAQGYAHGFEAMTTDRAVCANVPLPSS